MADTETQLREFYNSTSVVERFHEKNTHQGHEEMFVYSFHTESIISNSAGEKAGESLLYDPLAGKNLLCNFSSRMELVCRREVLLD